MDQQATKVELLHAFLWTCPECGRDKFERSIVAELSAEEREELLQDHGLDVRQEGVFCTAPKFVTCPDCQISFETAHFNADLD